MSGSRFHHAYLDRTADRIERALSALSRPARVDGGKVGTGWVRYHLTPMAGTKPQQVMEIADRVADAIGASEVRVGESTDGIAMDVPYDESSYLGLLPLMRAIGPLAPLTAVVGATTTGKPLLLRLNKDSTWNIVISGPPQSGKSELLRTLLLSLALTSRRSQLQLLGVDIGGRELAVVEATPHALTDLATDEAFACEMILWLEEEAERRQHTGVKEPHLVLAVDDLPRLLSADSHPLAVRLERIAAIGPRTGVHFVVCATYADRQLPPGWKKQATVTQADALDSAAANRGGAWQPVFRFHAGGRTTDATIALLGARDLDLAIDMLRSGWRTPSALSESDAEQSL